MSPTNKKTLDTKPYMEARQALLADLKTELIGPEIDPDILLIENPVTRYSAGMIFPFDYDKRRGAAEEKDPEDNPEAVEGVSVEESTEEITSSFANSFFPSAIGLSFYAKGKNPSLIALIECATYEKAEFTAAYVTVQEIPEEILTLSEFEEYFTYEGGRVRLKKVVDRPKDIEPTLRSKASPEIFQALHKLIVSQAEGTVWTRVHHKKEVTISADVRRANLIEGLDLVVIRKYIQEKDLTLFTIALENTKEPQQGLNEDGVFFQTSLKIESLSDNVFTEYGIGNIATGDKEDANLAMLYRNKKAYAVGHGCAADWKIEQGNVQSIFTEIVPTYEVPQSSFEIAGLESAPTLEMRYLAGITGAKQEAILDSLREFCTHYEKWIHSLKDSQSEIAAEFTEHAEHNISLCTEVLGRMKEGISILARDKNAYEAFATANKAMLMQSLHSNLQKIRRNPGDSAVNWPDISDESLTREKKWRPFQVAFLLLSINGTVNPESADRRVVDLIWFPTGGGKTEAYLGLSAFTILYNRLKSPSTLFGTTIMMRYTLRLLTAQQFQRACTLICALEVIRRLDSTRLGNEEISIGLWVGSASTPNTIDEAEKKFNDFISGSASARPSPVLSCPWCGTRMLLETNGSRQYAMRKKNGPKRIELYCKENTCAFNAHERLPIKFVDEDIYNAPPTLLFGTVDKFAQMPKKEGVSSIFGLDGKGNGPELIIQDELHLISGALGTMVALYETAVDFLSSRKGKNPKIIASTATVRRAEEQCKNLFGRVSRQFPSPGLEIEDSFFSKEDAAQPGRMYIGVMPSGKTQTTSSVRITAKLLQSVYELALPDEVKDKYWTLVAYFNSIRELGGFISLVNDDIKLYANDLHLRYGHHMRPIIRSEELTSRKRAEDIPQILEHLSIEYKGGDGKEKAYQDKPFDILEATNMISVGVDIDRFGLMLIRGQPKMTSEYIQVSSRIGRRYPGVVVTLYNQARTRDRAHYERFITYHSSFYKSVEPSSITPFSLPARVRALNAVLVTMVRHSLKTGSIGKEKGVVEFTPDLPGIAEIKDFMIQRAKLIDPAEASEVEKDIDRGLQEWQAFLASKTEEGRDAVYSVIKLGKPLMASSAKDRRPVGWIAPNSMRNVDAECNINTKDE